MRHNSCFISIEKHHIGDLLETEKKTVEIFYVATFANVSINSVVLDLLLMAIINEGRRRDRDSNVNYSRGNSEYNSSYLYNQLFSLLGTSSNYGKGTFLVIGPPTHSNGTCPKAVI